MGCGSSHSAGRWPLAAPLPAVLAARRFVSSSSGLLLAHASWQPPAGVPPRAIVYLVHGYAEHMGRYAAVTAALAQAGFVVRALDLVGHGASEGDRAYVHSVAAVCADIVQLATDVHGAADAALGLPRFLLGHSMGGLLALRVASGDYGGGRWAGVVLSAPALAVDPRTDTPLNRFLARSLSAVWPQLQVAPLDVDALCTDAAVVADYKRDPLNFHGKLRVRTGAEVLAAIADARAAVPRLHGPLLVLHGTADKVCRVEGSRALADDAHKAGVELTLKEYALLFHEIFFEPQSTCLADAVEWMRARVDARPTAGA